ncbi:MAG: DNA mismatch repair endonuclease MutL [Selenomonadaceae bacterium]
MSIHLLDDGTINKIAAGEVVERPASVVKELMENSLDAGAKRIEVEAMAGGTSLMRVTDDGCGMDAADARLSVERHATSKIKGADDIVSIETLGFRGEALATIAAVSRFSLATRRAGDELGTRVVIIGGAEPDISEAGTSVGTTVKVEDLFFNTPARKKFLKTTHTEAARISDVVTKQALANPAVAVKFISNNKISLNTPGTGDLTETIASVYGHAAAESLLPLSFEDADDGIKITGYITKPSMIRASRSWQTFITNGRLIENKAIARAIDNAYHSLLPKAGYPLVVMNIEVPPRSIDVNVHPRKNEIKFEDEQRIFRAVYKSVVDAIRPEGQRLTDVAGEVLHPENYAESGAVPFSVAPVNDGMGGTFAQNGASTSTHSILPHAFSPSMPLGERESMQDFMKAQQKIQSEMAGNVAAQMENNGAPIQYEAGEAAMTQSVAETSLEISSAEATLTPMIPIGQVGLCFIIAQDSDTLYIIDQHAAHERILYDKFAAMADRIPSQELLIHLVLNFSRQECEIIEKNRELFKKLGFDMEPAGESEYRLRAVPMDIPTGDAEMITRKIIESLINMKGLTAAEIRHACIAMTACKAAIKRGEELSLRQMQILLDELSKTSRPYTCPHGRPTILRFTGKELFKMFKRT